MKGSMSAWSRRLPACRSACHLMRSTICSTVATAGLLLLLQRPDDLGDADLQERPQRLGLLLRRAGVLEVLHRRDLVVAVVLVVLGLLVFLVVVGAVVRRRRRCALLLAHVLDDLVGQLRHQLTVESDRVTVM